MNMNANQEVSMFKLILLDYSMQDMNGPQVAMKVRELVAEHNLNQPLICCCSAYTE